MKTLTNGPALLVVIGCLVATGVQGAAVDNRFLRHFISSDDVSTVTAASVGNVSQAVNDSPVVTSQGSFGKKIQITITKEIGGQQGHGHGVAGGHGAAAHAPHGHNNAAPHAAHAAHAGHNEQVASSPAQLQLNGSPSLVIDNETMADLLQQILAGNLQKVENHGRPLQIPRGGKPVAVIFSSSMQVVDLGDLRPPTTPAPVTQAPHTHAPHAPHPAPAAHNATHAAHPAMDHTSLLDSLISPLMSLTHLGAAHPNEHPPVQQVLSAPAQAQMVQPMQMQPVVMMMPVPQMQGVPLQAMSVPSGEVDSLSPLTGVLEGILAAKQQLLNATLLTGHQHSPHEAHAAGGHAVHAAPPPHVAPVAAVQAQPVVAQQPTLTKTVDISITKRVP